MSIYESNVKGLFNIQAFSVQISFTAVLNMLLLLNYSILILIMLSIISMALTHQKYLYWPFHQ